jgi:MATE family multidrug resistance protein
MTSTHDIESGPAPALPAAAAPADGHPVAEILRLAAPTVMTMASYTVMQFVDKWMVSRIDSDPIWVGAQGNGGLAAWIPISIVMGTLMIVNTFVSQNLGAGKAERAPAYAWAGLWVCVAAWIALIPYGLALPAIFEAMGHDARRVGLEASYGQILVFGSILTMASRAISQFFYGMHRPSVVLVAGLAGNLTNLVFNYGLIYGNLGMPRLEMAGAAWATLIGTAVELAIPMALFLGPTYNRAFATRRAWRPSRAHLKEIFRIGWPGGAMFGNEMVCWGFFMVYLVGFFGATHSTAGWIAHQWMSLSFMPAVGISVAVTAMVGKCIGMGRHDLAAKRAWAGLGIAVAYMGLCGVAFLVFREPMIRLFIEDGTDPAIAAEVIRLGSMFMIATAAFQLFDAIAMTISGALRGAGDTVWVGIVTVGLAWSLIVGGGLFFVTFMPELESLGPWLAAASYIIILSLTILGRFLTGKWRRISLVAPAAALADGPCKNCGYDLSGLSAANSGEIVCPECGMRAST